LETVMERKYIVVAIILTRIQTNLYYFWKR
jgi:hypothetical protein